MYDQGSQEPNPVCPLGAIVQGSLMQCSWWLWNGTSSNSENWLYLYEGRPPHNPEFIYKNCVFILTCLNFSHLQSTLHLMQYTYRDIFFHSSEQFLNSSILMPFSASAIFCSASFTSAKCFPLRTFFIQGNKNKVTRGKIRWIGRVGHQESCHFRSKTAQHLNTQCLLVCAGALRNSPIMKWAKALKESSKKFTDAKHGLSQQCQLVPDTGGFLEHSPSGGSLYCKGPVLHEIIQVFGGPPSHILWFNLLCAKHCTMCENTNRE